MDLDPIWVEVVFPMGMRPAQVFGGGDDGNLFSTIDNDSEDGGAVEELQARSANSNAENKKEDDEGEFSSLGTLSRNQIKIMASYIDNIVTGIVNDELPTLSRFYWEAYLDTHLVDSETLYPAGVPPRGQGEKGATLRVEADLRGETQMVLRYEVSGQYSFVNITDTVLPSRANVRTATAEALNANVLYRELRRSEHPLLSELELLTVDWADYGTNNTSTYKILGSVIFVMLLGLLGSVGYVYHKRRVGRKSGSGGLIGIDENDIGNDNASSWFSGDESSVRRLSSWREGNQKNGKTTDVSPSKTAFSDGDLDVSGLVSIPRGDAEESILSSVVAPAGPIDAARNKWNAFAARTFGRRERATSDGASDYDSNMSSRYYDDEPSVMPSAMGESVIEDASSIGDMTKFTKFTYQDIAKRKDIDLLETCNPNADDQSRMSLEESNVSSPRGDPVDQHSSAGEATADVGEVDIDASVGPSLLHEMETATEVGERGADFSLIQSEMGTATEVGERAAADASLIQSEMMETATEVGERGADVSLLMSEADIEKSVAERAIETANGNETPPKNPIRATFASLWHKKKKDTPSKKFLRHVSSRQTSAAVEAEMIVPDTNVAGVAEQDRASEVSSDRGHPFINVSDDMTVVSALSIGGVSTIPASPARPTASKDANLMPEMDAAEDLQEDAIIEVDGEESSDEGPKNADQANVEEEQKELEVDQPEASVATDPPQQSLYPDSSDSEAEPSRQSLYPDSSDSEAENEEDSDAESNLEVKPIIENEGDGSTVAYAHITPMEEENESDADNAEGILEKTVDDDSVTVYEEERDAPNKSIEEQSSGEQDESQQAPGPAADLTSQEANSPTAEEATEATAVNADAPEEEPKSQQPHFEIDAVIKDALESKPSGESSEDELDGEISAAVEECSNLSESDEDDGESISSSSASSLIQEIVPNASPKKSPKRKSDGGA